MRWALVAGFLVMAGCLAGTGGPYDSNAPPTTDEPIAWPEDAYWDIPVAQMTYLERSARHLGGGPTSGTLQFHSWEQVEVHLKQLNATFPGLVDLRVLGETHLGRPIYDLVVTDESVAGTNKTVPILDGAHHGNEYAGGEVMLYAAEILLENWATNATVRAVLADQEIHVIPVVNPDGWVAATRFNGNGVNLNRNYDIDWGNPLGTSNPVMGTLGEASGQPVGGVALVAENCGAAAFSEPESTAIRDLMLANKERGAFYVTGHTATHAVIAPWAAFERPADLPDDHNALFESELQWVRDNTEYQAGKAEWGNLSAGLPYAASGSSMDYYYLEVQKPAFTVEVEYEVTSATSPDYPDRLLMPFDGFEFWMRATVPIPMHLIANARELSSWSPADRPALVPEGWQAAAQAGLEPAMRGPHL